MAKLYKREKYLQKIRGFYNADDIIKVIVGVRRCGKSSLLEMIVDELRDTGVADEQIIFFNLDKRGLRSIKTPEQLENLIETHSITDQLKYLFVDEIQNVKGFEEVINGFREEGNYSIFITGSNSYLLSSELTTKLTGRYVEFEMYPLSFDEYEEMKQMYGKTVSPNLLEELNQYILEGGFPRTVRFDTIQDKRTYIDSVVKEIFEKDIRKRVKIRNREAFEAVQTFIINNFGATTSISSLHDALSKNGITVSRSTLTRYIDALVSAKILYECPRFDMKSKRSLSGEKKYYLSDLSFYFSVNTDNKINYGPVLENIVYLYARSNDNTISVGRYNQFECDFITRNSTNDYAYLQVAYTILGNEKTEDREYRPLEAVRDNYPKYVITTDQLLQKRSGIHHVNLMEFMLSRQSFV